MKKTSALVVASIAFAGAAMADGMAPGDVVYADGAVSQSLTGVAGDPASGREIIISKSMGNCIACHGAQAFLDAPWHGEVGPPLDGVGDRWTEAELRGIIANAKMMFEGTVMPSFYKVDGFVRPGDGYTGKPATSIEPILTAQQIEDVVAFLATLKE